MTVDATLEEFVRTDCRTLPLPGSGETWRRFEVLASWASLDLSLGRLVEGHSDAVAILAQAGMEPVSPKAQYGVWAARSRRDATTAVLVDDGWILRGTKPFCSGSGLIDRALVVTDSDDGSRIFDVAVADQVTATHAHSWPAVGMADSLSATLDFGGPPIPRSREVGPANFYTERPGFWFGGAGVAACWYGGALGLLNSLLDSIGDDPSEHVLCDLGVAIAGVESMRRVLHAIADDIDRDPLDLAQHAHFGALLARQVVHDQALEVLTRVGAAGGARQLCLDGAQSRRAADLFAYLSQHHGGTDAAELGRLAKDAWRDAHR